MRRGWTRRQVLAGTAATGIGLSLVGHSSRGTRAGSSDAWRQFANDAANTGYSSGTTGPLSSVYRSGLFEPDAAPARAPTVDGDLILTGAGDDAVALDPVDFGERWRYTADGAVESAPVWAGGQAVFGDDAGVIHAVGRDGTEQWRTDPSGVYPSGSITGSVSVADGTVYVPDRSGLLHALDATDGSVRWTAELGAAVRATPAVADGTVYVGDGGGTLYALDAGDGSERWTYATDDGIYGAPAVGNGRVLVGSDDDRVHAVDVADGRRQWVTGTGAAVSGSPTIAGGVVVAASEDHRVYGLDPASGSVRWTYRTSNIIEASPAVADETVYVGNSDATVYALDVGDGALRWSWDLADPDDDLTADTRGVDSSAAVTDGSVLVATGDAVYRLVGDTSTPSPTAEETATRTATGTPNGTARSPTSTAAPNGTATPSATRMVTPRSTTAPTATPFDGQQSPSTSTVGPESTVTGSPTPTGGATPSPTTSTATDATGSSSALLAMLALGSATAARMLGRFRADECDEGE